MAFPFTVFVNNATSRPLSLCCSGIGKPNTFIAALNSASETTVNSAMFMILGLLTVNGSPGSKTKKTNTDLHVWKRCASPLKKQRPLKKFPPRNLTIFYLISLTKSGNLTHCVFNNCTIVFAQQSPPLPLQKRRRVVIDSDEDD